VLYQGHQERGALDDGGRLRQATRHEREPVFPPFRRATGNTFVDFVNRVRINRACQLLMESDRYITHICYEVGFNNVANFNRRFLEIKA